jgi:hypothetical protein
MGKLLTRETTDGFVRDVGKCTVVSKIEGPQ